MTQSANPAREEALALLKRTPGKRPQFFQDNGLDHMFAMVMELAAEVWVLRERVYAVEDVATSAGLPLHDLVERWRPSPAQAQELELMRKAMMQSLFRTIDTAAPPASDEGETADPVPPARPKS